MKRDYVAVFWECLVSYKIFYALCVSFLWCAPLDTYAAFSSNRDFPKRPGVRRGPFRSSSQQSRVFELAVDHVSEALELSQQFDDLYSAFENSLTDDERNHFKKIMSLLHAHEQRALEVLNTIIVGDRKKYISAIKGTHKIFNLPQDNMYGALEKLFSEIYAANSLVEYQYYISVLDAVEAIKYTRSGKFAGDIFLYKQIIAVAPFLNNKHFIPLLLNTLQRVVDEMALDKDVEIIDSEEFKSLFKKSIQKFFYHVTRNTVFKDRLRYLESLCVFPQKPQVDTRILHYCRPYNTAQDSSFFDYHIHSLPLALCSLILFWAYI